MHVEVGGEEGVWVVLAACAMAQHVIEGAESLGQILPPRAPFGLDGSEDDNNGSHRYLALRALPDLDRDVPGKPGVSIELYWKGTVSRARLHTGEVSNHGGDTVRLLFIEFPNDSACTMPGIWCDTLRLSARPTLLNARALITVTLLPSEVNVRGSFALGGSYTRLGLVRN